MSLRYTDESGAIGKLVTALLLRFLKFNKKCETLTPTLHYLRSLMIYKSDKKNDKKEEILK